MNALAEAYEAAFQEVARDPQSSRAYDAVALLCQQVDEYLATFPLADIDGLSIERRAALTEAISTNACEVLERVRIMLSVALQTEELGGHTQWSEQLTDVLDRLERLFARLGVPIDSSKSRPPIVKRDPAFQVANVVRRPQLEPYIAAALRDANVREIEPGVWYADLDAFPGVWANAASRDECLSTLAEALHEWLLIKLAYHDPDIPVVDGMSPAALVLG